MYMGTESLFLPLKIINSSAQGQYWKPTVSMLEFLTGLIQITLYVPCCPSGLPIGKGLDRHNHSTVTYEIKDDQSHRQSFLPAESHDPSDQGYSWVNVTPHTSMAGVWAGMVYIMVL